MSEKRFKFYSDDYLVGIIDTATGKKLNHFATIDLLNEQQDTIITLRRRLEKINGGYGHLTYRRGLTANEWLIESQERELKKKNEQISDLKEENEELKQRITLFEKQEDEFEQYTAQSIENMIANYRDD